MEDKDTTIARLQSDIKSRDKDIYLAATYGNQLFQEKTQLSLKIDELISQKELLEQEKYSLQLDLETQSKAVKSQTNELAFQRDEADSLLEKFKISEKENEALHKKIENIRKENQYLKILQEDLGVENKSLTDKMNLLEKQVKNFEDQAEKSLCEAEKDESQELQAQLNTYMLNNKELQGALSQIQCELEMVKRNENQLLQTVRELEETLSDRNAEISSYCSEIKIAKEEIDDLHAEIEALKFDQVDVKRRGNSVFAELDDRRHLVEREYKILRKKFEEMQKNYEGDKKELDRARGQMVILQSMASRDYQQSFIDQLEESLISARKDISDLTHKLSKIIKSKTEIISEKQKCPKEYEYDYLRVMLMQSQKKEKELQDEVLNLRTKNMYDNDKLVKVQFLLYKSKEDLDSTKQEIFKLKLKVKDLEQGIIQKYPFEPVTRKPNIEILEGFKPLTDNEKNEKPVKLNITVCPDENIIPGELELGEDGFKLVKPPRKSNRFILHEFNRVEPDEVNGDSLKSTIMKNEIVKETNNEETIIEEKGILKSKQQRSHSKISSSKKSDNCAQQ